MSQKTQNKRCHGAYFNVVGKGNNNNNGTDIGQTLLPVSTPLYWVAKGIIKLHSDSNFKALLGHDIDEPELQTLHEVLKGANTVLLLNNNDGIAAIAGDESLPWAFTAKYPGTVGNNLHVSVQRSYNKVIVSTLLNGKTVDQQDINVDKPESLMSKDFIKVKLTDRKTTTSPMTKGSDNNAKAPIVKPKCLNPLADLQHDVTVDQTGGTTKPVDISDLLTDALKTEDYNVAVTAGFSADSPLHKQLVDEIKHLREDNDIKVRGVIPYTGDKANYEGNSTVANGVVLGDGTELDATVEAGFFAGA